MAAGFRAALAGIVVGTAVVVGALVAPTATAAPGPAPAAAAQRQAPAAQVTAPLAVAPVRWAPPARAAIRPGVATETAGGGVCTAGFVFTGGGRTFLGQAAHCAGTGVATETDGCTSGTVPLGTRVTIRAADGTSRGASLAFSSWVTMQQNGESDPEVCAYNDFALVEIAAVDVADVNPSFPSFGGPTGIATGGLAVGDPVVTSGGGSPGAGRPTAGAGAGEVGGGEIDGGWGHELFTTSPAAPGDSGSAVLDTDGNAVGLLTTLTFDPQAVGIGATDVAKALAYANANGGLGDVELVLGTERFTPTPAGVPLTAVAPPAGPPLG